MTKLMDVSDPRSLNYGKHLSQDEVASLFSPDKRSMETVKRWLVHSGIPASTIVVPKSQGWVHFDTTTNKLGELLKTTYHSYQHSVSHQKYIGTESYYLPRYVSNVVDFITPGVSFARQANTRSRRGLRDSEEIPEILERNASSSHENDLSNCATAITPACVMAMYGLSQGSTAASGNQLGIVETDSQKYSQSDLDGTWADFAPYVPAGTGPTLDSVNGGTAPTTDPSQAGTEADLDFQVSIPLIYPQGTTLYQIAEGSDGLLTPFLDAIDGSFCVAGATGQCGAYAPTNVISVSYGTGEYEHPPAYLHRQCSEFMKLGLQGVTVVFASGDSGVATPNGPCLGPNKNVFVPSSPGDCPYVTSVGATALPPGSTPGDAESAVVRFSSGGGFSNVFTTPTYQSSAVQNYLVNNNPGYPSYTTSNGSIPNNGGLYNSAGRGYPDMSAIGSYGVAVQKGARSTFGGTSMAAPIAAALFTRINEERLAGGKSPIGFVNPTLYQNPDMFNDITVGDQSKGGPSGDGSPSACGNNGFSAVAGWDPVTGLGSPNYPAMLQVFMGI